jgi:hypothetical protein
VPVPEHPMLPHLVDLESHFDVNAFRPYNPVELVRYALGASDYWAGLALGWLEDGVPAGQLVDELSTFEAQAYRPQPLRHRARRLRKRA